MLYFCFLLKKSEDLYLCCIFVFSWEFSFYIIGLFSFAFFVVVVVVFKQTCCFQQASLRLPAAKKAFFLAYGDILTHTLTSLEFLKMKKFCKGKFSDRISLIHLLQAAVFELIVRA